MIMDLSLQLRQKQVLSQRMQQSAEILQMNTLALSEYIHTLSEENPLLEWTEPQENIHENDRLLEQMQWLHEADEQNRYLYQMEQDSDTEQENARFGQSAAPSLQDYLHFQISMLPLEKQQQQMLDFLAQNLRECGYLEDGALQEMQAHYHLSDEQAQEILSQLQSLDPSGVGARNLQECLLIQLRAKNASKAACLLVETALEDLAKNRISYLAKKLHLSITEIQNALEEIKACSPKPGSGFAAQVPTEYIVPDVFAFHCGTELEISLNATHTPRIFVSSSYQNILKTDGSEQTKEYIAKKLRQAQWAVECIHKREDTLLATTQQIAAHQREFFDSPTGTLKPLRMADIAEKMQVHESTISRAVKDKYLQCERGIFPLSFFFSKGIAVGTENVSVGSIQEKIVTLIENEDKHAPLSDRELTEKLIADGVKISRRTVAKYREGMGIAGAAGRKQYD